MVFIKKKIIKLLLGGGIISTAFFIAILIACLMMLDFGGSNITDGYVENNFEYADMHKSVLNKNIKTGNGYVSLERILYFYLEDDSITFEEIYTDNLDTDSKKQKTISEVCSMSKYSSMSVCDDDEINESGQIDEDQVKPFNAPLVISNMNVTSFFMEERVVFGTSDVHEAWDLSSSNQTKVYSVCDGTVTSVSFNYTENVTDTSGGGGNQITIECPIDDDITYTVLYAHLYPNSSKVKVGDSVTHWQEIAGVGTTGYSTGPHLHYQVSLNGTKIDGMSLIDFTYELDGRGSYFNINDPLLKNN